MINSETRVWPGLRRYANKNHAQRKKTVGKDRNYAI